MTTPGVAGARLAAAFLLGAVAGLSYGFLRPLRRRSAALADLLFFLSAFLIWLYLGFGVCAGDLRLGYWIGLVSGGFVWELTLGRLLRPVFSGFWRLVFTVLGFPVRTVQKFFKKIREFCKKLFASEKKSGTIEWNMYPQSQERKGGRRYGR